ncbi:MAG: DUF1993 family protein [Geminicoccaceae bacterium]
MNDDNLFHATVPVFRHYLGQIDQILSRVVDTGSSALERRLTPDMFSAGEHLRTSQGFVLRTLCPLIGREPFEPSTDQPDPAGLGQRSREIRVFLHSLSAADFEGAGDRDITHRAGQAELSQSASHFVTTFALPNFFFHLTMGYATLRQAGIPIGKVDFDGQHFYPSGFSFTS